MGTGILHGGWDNERYRLYGFGYDPEYNTYNGNFASKPSTLDKLLRRRCNRLTRYAGEVVDIRFRFRSGLMGSVGPDGSSQDTGLDGFAFDNISIRKTDVIFGTEEVVSQTLSFSISQLVLPRKYHLLLISSITELITSTLN